MTNSFDARSALATSENQAEHQLTALLDRVPGYAGYRDKEDRRDADRAIRENIAQGLSTVTDRVDRVARDLADRRKMHEVSAVDPWIQALRHLQDRILTASYGYGGVFGDTSIDAEALDQLRLFDEALLERLQALEGPTEALEAALVADGDYQGSVDRGLAVTRDLASSFDHRTNVVTTGTAATETNVLAALEAPGLPAVSASWSLDAGDAVSILGDDYIVDARLHVGSGNEALRLFRLGERAAGRWLFVPHDTSKSQALAQVSTDFATGNGEPVSKGQGNAEMIGPSGAPRSAAASYQVFMKTDNPDGRTIIVEWPNERMVWTGETVAANDVTIYGSSGGTT